MRGLHRVDKTMSEVNLDGIAEKIVLVREDVPDGARVSLALTAFGYSATEIGRILGHSSGYQIGQWLKKYDPSGEMKYGSAVQKLVLGGIAGKLAFEALRSISGEDIEKMNAEGKMRFATSCMKVMEVANGVTIPSGVREDTVVDGLKG